MCAGVVAQQNSGTARSCYVARRRSGRSRQRTRWRRESCSGAMGAAGGEASAPVAAAASKRAPGLPPARAKPPSAPTAADEPAASAQPGGDDREAGTADPDEEVDDVDVFNGRPDLAQNTIEELRSRHRQLKQQQKSEVAAAQPKAQTRPGVETNAEPGHRISPPGAYGQRHRFQRGRLWRSKRSVSLENRGSASRVSAKRGALVSASCGQRRCRVRRVSRIAQIERSAICDVQRARILTHTNPIRTCVYFYMYIEQDA
jgi:hypothetical protein